MPPQVYHLPDLLALAAQPAIGHLNPHLKQVDSNFNEWVKKTCHPTFADEVYKAQIPYLTAAMSPHSSYEELTHSADFVLSTLILEVLTDNVSSAVSAAISKAWMNIVRGTEDPQDFDHPLLQVFRKEIVPSVKGSMEPVFWDQLVTVSEEYSSNVANEALHREAYANKNQVQDITSYLKMRRESAGLPICFTLTRAYQKIYISNEVLAHPVIRGLEEASADMSVFTNDIYSYKKEYGRDECLNNFLTLSQNSPKTAHLSLQERIELAGNLWKEALDRFYACKSRLPSFGVEVDKHVAAYVQGLLENAVGNVEWSLYVPRYHVFDSDSDRKNNILRLSLDDSEPCRMEG